MRPWRCPTAASGFVGHFKQPVAESRCRAGFCRAWGHDDPVGVVCRADDFEWAHQQALRQCVINQRAPPNREALALNGGLIDQDGFGAAGPRWWGVIDPG